MPDKKEEIRQNSELNDEELENVAGGITTSLRIPLGIYYIFNAGKEGVAKDENLPYEVLDDRGHVLYRAPNEEEAYNFAFKISGQRDGLKNSYEISRIHSEKAVNNLRKKANINRFLRIS